MRNIARRILRRRTASQTVKSAAPLFTTADRDAQDEVAATQLETGSAIIKLQAHVATLLLWACAADAAQQHLQLF